jgi:NAD+ diphosphatase
MSVIPSSPDQVDALRKKGEIAPHGIEIESGGWFDRDHLPDLPLQLSITRALIDHWVSGK